MKLIILLILSVSYRVAPFEFEAIDTVGVVFDKEKSTLLVDENNEPVTIQVLKIINVSDEIVLSESTKTVILATDGDCVANNECFITIVSLDFEAISLSTFIISVYEKSDPSGSQRLILTINNLDDEKPTLAASPCTMDENAQIDVDSSECVFTVSDPDGWLASMDFSNIETYGNIFELKYKNIPRDEDKQSDVYLVIKADSQPLDYETKNLYSFHINAKDHGGHATTLESVPIIVQVGDVSDEPPRWDAGFRSAITITEKTETNISVSATDGDIGINNPINYKITDSSGFISINSETGQITIVGIDRDAGNNDVTFTVTAFEVPEPDSLVTGDITLIIEDLDDNVAIISADKAEDGKLVLEIDEGTLDLNQSIAASDIDLGNNALYNANLISLGDTDFTEALTIIPSRGYENTSLSLTILDPKKLDYEDKNWRIITLKLETIGIQTPENTDSLEITINLLDINDEIPTFDQNEYAADIREDVAKDYSILQIQATDKDQEDIDAGVKHVFLGTNANKILSMPEVGGLITTKIDDAFDYEKQQEVIVQIKATDLVENEATAQLTITVIDVNDENPHLQVSSTVTVDENRPDGFILDTQITASDDDTKPYLTFSIDWANSYAMKNSIKLKQDTFDKIHFIDVKTIREDGTNQTVTAQLQIIETQENNTPDFEVYDTLYLSLVVTDEKTEKAGAESATAMIVISINDLNDNYPVFPKNTENEERTVAENSASGTLILSPIATDADVGDNLTYSIESANAETPNWMTIDSSTGAISVKLEDGEELDCDYHSDILNYKITVTDGVHPVSVVITIKILDDNDEKPTLENQSVDIEEVENGSNDVNGKEVITLKPQDLDRSEPYHTVECQFAQSTSSEITNRFAIENNVITVRLQDGYNLDREEHPTFQITLSCRDNPSGSKFNTVDPPPVVAITLLDINDNKPYIEKTEFTGLTENSGKGTEITLQGLDDDEGDNAIVEFLGISKIKRFDEDNQDLGEQPSDLFVLESSENNQGILKINHVNLEDYFGTLILSIDLTDKGTLPQSNSIDVSVSVAKYNFKEPSFYSPLDNEYFYLQYDQDPDSRLTLYDGTTKMDYINATDQQNNKFKLNFQIVSVIDKDNNEIDDLFSVTTRGNTWGELRMSHSGTNYVKKYQLILQAQIAEGNVAGSAPTAKNVSFTIDFFDEQLEDPTFDIHEGKVDFPENLAPQSYQLPKANYSKTELPPNIAVYYVFEDADKTLFSIDTKAGIITLIEELDFEKVTQYVLKIRSSNTPAQKETYLPDTDFTLTVNVKDVNDNPPVIQSKSYITTCNIATSTVSKDVLVQVIATDVDTTSEVLRYQITKVQGSTDALNKINDPFKINSNGDITQNFEPTGITGGYFTLEVTVRDESDDDAHKDTTQVIIYLVTNEHLVIFNFENDQATVQAAKAELKATLDADFETYTYVTNVGDPQNKQSEDGSPRTAAPIFFVSTGTNIPVTKTDIYSLVTNINFYRQLRSDLLKIGLSLLSFDSTTSENQNMEETLKAWLIGISVVLGSLCMILIVAFILKTRTLKQRINKLSSTRFGSQESGLNRTGVAAPTTNKHTIEGSNPVYSKDIEKPEIEERRESIVSGDSDLIGVEDDDKFDYQHQTGDANLY